MKEPVHKPRYPWVWGVAIAAIAAVYVYLIMGNKQSQEPDPSLQYDITNLLAIDQVDTRFKEAAPIVPDFEDPKALETDKAGNVFVGGKDTIAVYNHQGQETARFAVEGTPHCLEFTPDGRLLAGVDDKVLVLRPDGNLETTWTGFAKRALITSIAAGKDEVFLADAANRCVFRVDYDGKVLNRIGEMDEKRDIPGLEVPSPYFDVAFDSDGQLWVVNPGKLGLERYRSNGDIVTSWYHPSVTELDGFSGCCNPSQIAFNNEGRLVTGEKGPVRIKIYEVTSGQFEELVAGSSDFHVPQSIGDLAVDSNDRILVIDPKKSAVRIFEATTPKLAANSAARPSGEASRDAQRVQGKTNG